MDRPIGTNGSLLAQPTLVVNQKLKLFELRNEYGIFDQHGNPIGSVAQVQQSLLALLTRLFSSLDVALPTTLEVREAGGQVVLRLHKPWFRWAVEVSWPDGTTVGSVTKQIRMGKARFSLRDQAGIEAGEVRAENWRAKDFAVLDRSGSEVARVTKKWAGLRELFTDADNYVVQLRPELTDPLRSLAVGSVLAIDTIMKQKDTS